MKARTLSMAVLAAVALAETDAHKSFQEMMMENGWAQEMYTVKTADGYVSTLFRIPGKLGEAPSSKKPVLMQHGILCDSNFFTLNDPDKNPAFILAEQGYDVWLGNNRGNNFGRFHVDLATHTEEFWDFSWEEMGVYDTPAHIDYILEKTGYE
jgi:gastric triacylglycerol lipase